MLLRILQLLECNYCKKGKTDKRNDKENNAEKRDKTNNTYKKPKIYGQFNAGGSNIASPVSFLYDDDAFAYGDAVFLWNG